MDEAELPGSTPVYRYLSTEAFLFFLEYKRILITKISEWPDSYEGTRFEFLKRAKNNEFAGIDIDDVYASCWSLQTEERCLFLSENEYTSACDELAKSGSAAMWESYCKNGGVRIKTTLEKLRGLLANQLLGKDIYHGKVYYEPSGNWERTTKASSLISTLLHKRVSFRSEAEYRFIVVGKNITEKRISVPVGDIYDFVDEILISPATTSNRWLSRTLYNIAVGLSISFPERTTINNKQGNQYCRISQLYNQVTETIGHNDQF